LDVTKIRDVHKTVLGGRKIDESVQNYMFNPKKYIEYV
jgi:hypothetical protein